ncbi:MAG: hypothetical protein EZS28_047901 [Streblomastix strix]|uniref:Tyr recombinase domain-containing protein n=1 Tax=Streblomastix strix TaxID=222440 RepID=A0A5J4TF78_9EUKA|nr:MAG: hypothetical protein EZS28_047901 [Streblomastix strix]
MNDLNSVTRWCVSLSSDEKKLKVLQAASLLMSLCLVRMEEMVNIDLSVSIRDDEEHTAAVCIPHKQSRMKKRYDVRRTEDPRVCPTEPSLFGYETQRTLLIESSNFHALILV